MIAPRLVLMDDRSPTACALDGIFARMGWDVATARTLEEARPLLDGEPGPTCLILLDLDLPDGRAEDLIAMARDRRPGTRLVLASGSLDNGRLKAIATLGPDLMLRKPIRVEDVWDGICRICNWQ